jgi:hypothetical protein
MTGSIHQLNRQHSSTTSSSTMEKIYRSKLRRSSSVDDLNSIELIPDDNQHKEFPDFKREHTTSDVDSGTEEIEQQLESAFTTTFNDNEDTLSVKSIGQNFDEGFSESEREIQSQRFLIKKDRKLSNTFFLLCHPDSAKFSHDVILNAIFFSSVF